MTLAQMEQVVVSASSIANSQNSALIITLVGIAGLCFVLYKVAIFVMHQFKTDKGNAWVTIENIFTYVKDILTHIKDIKGLIVKGIDILDDIKENLIKINSKLDK